MTPNKYDADARLLYYTNGFIYNFADKVWSVDCGGPTGAIPVMGGLSCNDGSPLVPVLADELDKIKIRKAALEAKKKVKEAAAAAKKNHKSANGKLI